MVLWLGCIGGVGFSYKAFDCLCFGDLGNSLSLSLSHSLALFLAVSLPSVFISLCILSFLLSPSICLELFRPTSPPLVFKFLSFCLGLVYFMFSYSFLIIFCSHTSFGIFSCPPLSLFFFFSVCVSQYVHKRFSVCFIDIIS